MVTSGSSAPERCVVRSKARIELIVSPHHSSRAGAAMPKPYTSTMPPRTVNSATSVTVGDAGVPHPLERTRRPRAAGDSSPAASCSRSDFERGRHGGALGAGARRRDQQAQLAAQQRLERLDALAGDLEMRLVLAQRFALRIERDALAGQVLQVGEPALGVGGRGGDDGDQAAGADMRSVSQVASTAPLEPGTPPRRSVLPRAGIRSASARTVAQRSKASRIWGKLKLRPSSLWHLTARG